MEQQILQAVEIALSGSADMGLKSQAIDFINQVKSTEEGYNSCLDILVNSISEGAALNQEFKFFILQVLEENLSRLAPEQLFSLSQKLFQYTNYLVSSEANEPVFLRNKLAAVMGNLFSYSYTNVNPNFIKDLLSIVSGQSLLAYDLYSRIMLAIHTEIGDRFITRSREIQDRNNVIKDQIRVNDMELLVTDWQKVLSNPEIVKSDDDIIKNYLKIVGSYISWMEITLFINQGFISTLLQYLNKPQQRSETCATLIEVISKKMKPLNKIELISILDLCAIINSFKETEDLEFNEWIAKLANQTGLELLYALEQSEGQLFDSINDQILALWPSILTLLSNEYDDVSQHVFGFIQQYLLDCKKYHKLKSLDLLSSLLNKLVLKMKFDEDDDGTDDESAEQFEEIRSKLKVFQDTIAVLAPDLYLEVISIVIEQSIFSQGEESGKTDWRNLELGLFELSKFGDSLKNNLIDVPKSQIHESKPFMLFREFFIRLIKSDLILKIDHPRIQSDFFDLIVRHYNFITNNSSGLESEFAELVPRILEIFTSPLGLFNNSEKTRLRCWYLFFRFVKLSKPVLSNPTYIENLFVKLQPLLVVKAELPTRNEDNIVIENDNFSTQLNLFESLGLLVASSAVDDNLKVEMIDIVFQPLFNDLEKCIASNDSNVKLLSLQANHLLLAIGTFARGYELDSHNRFTNDVVAKVDNAAHVVLVTLEHFSKFEVVRESARFAFARFIPFLGNRINNHLSKLISLILAANNLTIIELADFLNFLGQVVYKFKTEDNTYQLLNDLLTPLFDKVFVLLEYNGENNEYESMPDIVRDKEVLKRAYMNLISAIITNHLSSLFITETNKQKFPVILESLVKNAYIISETNSARSAITQLINIVTVMGACGGKIDDPLDKYSNALPAIEGVDEYLMDKVLHISFEIPFQNQQFDLKDAQCRLIAQEISVLLKTYQEKNGEPFLNVLSNYLISLGLSQNLMNDFGTHLVKLDQKDFKKYFVNFISELKGK